MKMYRSFNVSYRGATDTLSSRIVIKDNYFGSRKVIPYQCESCLVEAKRYLESKGILIIGMSNAGNDFILFSEEFDTSIK